MKITSIIIWDKIYKMIERNIDLRLKSNISEIIVYKINIYID